MIETESRSLLRRTAALFLFAAATAAFAQVPPPSGSLSGLVRDPSGRPVPDAVATARQAGTALEATARADAEGRFLFAALAPGRYELEVTRAGFSVSAVSVVVEAGASRAVEVSLWPGQFTEEVHVVASRLAGNPEEARRVPGSFTVLDREALESTRVLTTSEALRKVSGVSVRDEEGFGLRPNVGIRGLNPSRSSKVLLLEDGIPVTYAPYGDNASYYHPPIERFERIEVLKGSGQIAYGPVTVGGVVNYVTADPPAEPGGTITLTGGSREYWNGRISWGGTWGETGVQVDYLRKQGDGARENVHSRLDDVLVKVTRQLGERQSLTLRANYYGEDSQVTYSGLREDEWRANPRQNPFANDDFEGDRWGGSVTHTLRLSTDFLLTTNVYTSSFRRHWWRQSSNSGQRPNDSADPACGGMANLDTTCGNEGRLRRYVLWGIEPRARIAHHLLGISSEAELGVRAHFEDQERRQVNGDTPTARTGRLVENNERRNQAYSGFVQNRFLAGRWTITPGVRLERVFYERTNRLGAGGAGVSGRTALTQVVPGIGVSFEAAEATTLFAGAHRGFAPPRTEDVINNATGGSIDLDPELSWNYEVGVRSRVADGIEAEATLFVMDYENQVVPASLAGGVGATLTNGGATRHEGAELAIRADSATLFRSLHDAFLRIAWTWLPVAEFRGVRSSNVPGFGDVSVSGNRLPYASEHLLTAAVGYRHPSGFEGSVEAVSVGEQFADDLNTVTPSADGQRGLLPSHTLWNASVGWQVPSLRSVLFASVKNVFDRTVIVDRSRGILPGTPRLLQLGVKVRI